MMRQARIRDGAVDYYSGGVVGSGLNEVMEVVNKVLGNKKLIGLVKRVYPFLPRTWEIRVNAAPRNPTEDMEATESVDFVDMGEGEGKGDTVTFGFEYHYDKRPVLLETAYGPREGPPEFWKTADPILKEAKKLGIEVDDDFYE